MTARERIAAPTVLMYWLLLVTGLALYGAIRIDDLQTLTPLFVGALAGTAIGQGLALRDFRLWVAALTMIVVIEVGVSFTPRSLDVGQLWMVFAPAMLCGYWSLSDRGALAAFWFPAMVWMLSILDRTHGASTPDGAGIVLLAGLAIAFLVFLRVRESRRVMLWRTVSSEPLATPKASAVLKEPPRTQLARAGWGLVVTAITFAVTAWVAPRLWQVESFDAPPVPIVEDGPALAGGMPCCEIIQEYTPERSRVKEFLDLGRGHDEPTPPRIAGIDCRRCEGEAVATDGFDDGTGTYYRRPPIAVEPIPARPIDPWDDGSTYRSGGGGVGGEPPVVAPPSRRPYVDGHPTRRDRHRPHAHEPARAHVRPPPPPPAPPPPPPPLEPQQLPPAPDVAPAPPVPPAPAPPPVVEPPPVAEQSPPPPPMAEPTPPPAVAAPPTPTPVAPAPAHRPPPRAALGSSLLHWLVVLIAGALVFQLVALGLRPIRRAITVRHLRRPFWDETVDQRVSNSWQLALIGLRDAGWRATASEPPRDFAKRTGIDGVEQCAAILERTRHGIAIDDQDLTEMTSTAEAVYRAARARLGGIARLIAWIRWPLA